MIKWEKSLCKYKRLNLNPQNLNKSWAWQTYLLSQHFKGGRRDGDRTVPRISQVTQPYIYSGKQPRDSVSNQVEVMQTNTQGSPLFLQLGHIHTYISYIYVDTQIDLIWISKKDIKYEFIFIWPWNVICRSALKDYWPQNMHWKELGYVIFIASSQFNL